MCDYKDRHQQKHLQPGRSTKCTLAYAQKPSLCLVKMTTEIEGKVDKLNKDRPLETSVCIDG